MPGIVKAGKKKTHFCLIMVDLGLWASFDSFFLSFFCCCCCCGLWQLFSWETPARNSCPSRPICMFVSLSLSLALFCRRNFPSHHHGPHDDACPVVLCVPNLPRLQSCSNLCVICECLTSPLLLFAWFLVHCTGAADQLQEEPPPHYKAFLHQLMIQSHPCHRRLLRPRSCTR